MESLARLLIDLIFKGWRWVVGLMLTQLVVLLCYRYFDGNPKTALVVAIYVVGTWLTLRWDRHSKY
jgi:hypothetical protein